MSDGVEMLLCYAAEKPTGEIDRKVLHQKDFLKNEMLNSVKFSM